MYLRSAGPRRRGPPWAPAASGGPGRRPVPGNPAAKKTYPTASKSFVVEIKLRNILQVFFLYFNVEIHVRNSSRALLASGSQKLIPSPRFLPPGYPVPPPGEILKWGVGITFSNSCQTAGTGA